MAREGASAQALDRAQDIAFDAMEAPSRSKRIALAKKALAISPLCADAYLVLGMEAKPAEALGLFRQAVEAGEKALGEAAFRDEVGDFWALLETRPYMRARQELAGALWGRGAHDEAAGHYQDMLRLNPNDNQGVRYALINVLLELGRDREAGELLKTYENDALANWPWSAALLAFRQHGDGPSARAALAAAVKANSHIGPYLLDRKRLPPECPLYISPGGDDEAVAYVQAARDTWRSAEGALTWLGAALDEGPPEQLQKGDRRGSGSASEADRIDDAVLALMLVGLHDGGRAWKTFDWSALDRLHAKGLISNPASRAKSVVFTERGLEVAEARYRALFLED